MATVPLSGTNISLISSVPFNNDYKNSRWFTTEATQRSYFSSKPIIHAMSEANFQRIEGRHFIAVNKSIDDLWKTNYLMFQNASYNNKWFYAFVTKLEYKNRGTTHVHFEIDVLQTWKFDMNFKPSYVVREHRPLWNSDGTPVINNIDEGLSYGYDYETVSLDSWLPYNDIYFLVVASKSAVHSPNQDGSSPYNNQVLATNNGMQQPLTYYIHPFRMESGTHTQPNVSVNGSAYWGISKPLEFIQRLSEMTNTANNIASIYVTDYIGLDIDIDSSGNIAFDDRVEWAIIDDGTYQLDTLCVKDVLNYDFKTKDFGDKYSGFVKPTESKLLMHPYVVITLDDFKGNRVDIKPEYIETNKLFVTVRGSMGTSNKVTYGVPAYLTSGLTGDNPLLASLEYSLINTNPNDIPVVTDMLTAYLQGNRNSLINQKNSIGWNGGMNVVSNAVGMGASAVTRNPMGMASSGVEMIRGAGNTVLEMQGLLAKVQDIDNTPPQIQKMGSNTSYDYGNNYHGVYVVKKQIREEYRKILGDFFNMFGYKTNETKVPNFNTRQNWNYVETKNCTITGDFNNEDLQVLKNVFDGGITLWHTEDVGNYSLANGVK